MVGVAMVTAIIALAGQLNGTGASTFCIVIPVMFPIYMRMHMRKTTLLRIAILPMGIMNLLPWAGPAVRTAAVLGIEASSMWRTLLPVQMLDFSRVQNYYIACGYTDMHKQIDGLVAVVEL